MADEMLIKLNADKVFDLLEIISTLSKLSENIIISNGFIRQSTSKKTSYIICDIGSVVGVNELYLDKAASKAELLEPFKKQKVDLTILTKDGEYMLFDDVSKITYKIPNVKYMDCIYLQEEELKDIIKVNEDEDLIFDITLNKMHLDRLNAFSKTLGSNHLEIEFHKDKALFNVNKADLVGLATGSILTIGLTKEHEFENIVAKYSITPFLIGNGDIEIKAYHPKAYSSKNLMLKTTTSIGSQTNPAKLTVWHIGTLFDPEMQDLI